MMRASAFAYFLSVSGAWAGGTLTLTGGAVILSVAPDWRDIATVAGPTPGTFDYNAGANWNTGVVPTGAATFGASTTPDISFSTSTTVGGWTFNPDAAAYTFTNSNLQTLTFTGSGIVVNGGSVSLTNDSGGTVLFTGASSAGSANVTNSGAITFSDSSTAGSATIVNVGSLVFNQSATAGSATITNFASLRFDGGSAGSAQIENDNSLEFRGGSSAANAAINNAGGNIWFYDTANGGAAQFTNSGTIDFSNSSFNGGKLTAGSLGGSGQVYLGANELSIGGNNLSTTFSGVVSDCGAGADCLAITSGGSLVKTGSGTLTLSGVNTYTGGTTLAGGTLSVGADSGLGDAAGALTFDGGVLRVTGTTFISTARTINWGANGGGFDIADAGNQFQLVQTLSGAGGLTKLGAGTLTVYGFNDYSGPTLVSAGTLKSGSSGSLSSNSVHSIAAGAAIDLFGSTQIVGALSGAGNVINSSPDPAHLWIGIPGSGNITATFAGSITDGGAGATDVRVSGPGVFTVTGANTYTGGTSICFCSTLQIGDGGTTGSILGDVTNGGTLIFNRSNSYSFAGVISDDLTDKGKVVQAGSGVTVLSGLNTYSGGAFLNAGTLSVASDSNLGDPSGALTFNGGTLQITGGGFTSTARAINWGAQGGGFDIADAGTTFTLAQALTGTGGLTKAGAGTLLLSAANSYSGATAVTGGTLKAGATGAFSSASAFAVAAGATLDLTGTSQTIGSLAGAGAVANSSAATPVRLTAGGDGSSTSFAGVVSGATALTKTGGGTMTLSGLNTYSGDTVVSAGKLVVNGSIAASSGLTVAAGAIVGGSGQLPGTVVSGTISPGNSPGTITVNGNLVLNAGSTYLAEVQGAVADRINVTGAASLAGTLSLVPLGGVYTFNSPYTLLQAAGGVSGVFTVTGNAFGAGNPSSVARGIDRAVAAGADPTPFFNLFNQSAAALPGALNTVSGEVHTAANAIGVEVSDQFLRAMLDPFAAGRSVAAPASPYTVWGAALGRRGQTNGDPSGAGSATRTTESAAFATGADYRIAPDSVIGFALAGGGADASLASGMGSADAGVFEAGIYGTTRIGDLQLGASGAYTFLDVDTKRTAPVLRPGAITAAYHANGFSGRLEASYRVATLTDVALSPFAAFQAQSFQTPGFVEDGGSTGSLGTLTGGRQSNLTTRSELGLKLETNTVLGGYRTSGFLRASWAQYFNRDMAFSGSLNGLPGSNFTIDGAKPDHAALRLAAGMEIKLREDIAMSARFDSDLARNGVHYAGSIRLNVGF